MVRARSAALNLSGALGLGELPASAWLYSSKFSLARNGKCLSDVTIDSIQPKENEPCTSLIKDTRT